MALHNSMCIVKKWGWPCSYFEMLFRAFIIIFYEATIKFSHGVPFLLLACELTKRTMTKEQKLDGKFKEWEFDIFHFWIISSKIIKLFCDSEKNQIMKFKKSNTFGKHNAERSNLLKWHHFHKVYFHCNFVKFWTQLSVHTAAHEK